MVWLGVLLALGTSVSWAAGNVLTQRVGKLVGPPRAMLWSMAAGALLAAPCAAAFDQRTTSFSLGLAGWLAAASVAGVMAYIGLFFAFANKGLTVAVPIVSSWPLVAIALSFALFGESLHGRQWIGAGAVLAGVLLVALPSASSSKDEATSPPSAGARWALPAALAASLGFGIMIPAMGKVAPSTGAFGATVIVFVLGIALSLVIGRVAKVSFAVPPKSAWPVILATGAAETTGFVTVALARRFAPMALVAPVASLASVFTVAYAWAFLKERPRPTAAIGALLAGAGVAILAS
jgi:drug/metabolite transporter (DMT)-like permease